MEHSRGVPRAPRELQSALLEPPKTPPELQHHPRGLQSTPKGSPRDLQDAISGPLGPQNGSPGGHLDLKMEVRGAFGPQNGGLGVRSKKFRKTPELSTRVHNLQLEIGVSTRPNVDKTKRAWVANSSQDVRSEGGEPSSNCTSIFLNIQTSIGRRGSAGVAKRLE